MKLCPTFLPLVLFCSSCAAAPSKRAASSTDRSDIETRRWVTRIGGRLHPAKIQAVVRVNFERFHSCFDAGRQRDPSLAGAVAVRFRISRSGDVEGAHADDTTLSDPQTVSCIVGVFSSLHFPSPDAGIVDVVYPLQFAAIPARD